MSRTLNLVERVLARARHLQQLGVEDQALQALGELSRLADLESEVAEEVQSRLAELLFARGKHRKARRHLAAALAHQPDNAHYHHLMAKAIEADVHCNPARALAHWRRALELDADQPRYLSDFGLLAVREGQTEDGLAALRQAHKLAGDDPEVLASVTEGLCHAGLAEEARAMLLAARFRNPRDLAIQQLWNDFQYQQLHAQQAAVRRERLAGSPESEPRLLPFVRPLPGTTPAGSGGHILRRDRRGRRGPPHFTDPARLPGKKHA
jgi:tetratricopeptide (TPR) repeat protein